MHPGQVRAYSDKIWRGFFESISSVEEDRRIRSSWSPAPLECFLFESANLEISMPESLILDTFPAFQESWTGVRDASPDVQAEWWASGYMAHWPELLDKQIGDYSAQQIDWKKIATEKIFPHLEARLPAMETAHRNIITAFSAICGRARRTIGLDMDILAVIYVGIGCGAGWATRFQGSPAILFGLENIAECGWEDPESIDGLIAHEIGHLAQEAWLRQAGRGAGAGPWWQLFTEGFAQRCEQSILRRDSWHKAGPEDDEWLSWCTGRRAWLASEFLRTVAEGRDIRPFFGSWFEIEGHSECGYYLGCEAVRDLESSGLSLKEIAVVEEPEKWLNPILINMSRLVVENNNPGHPRCGIE